MRVSDFHFDLPEELIAQHPPAERGSSRMLVLDRGQGIGDREQGTGLVDAWFRDLPGLLQPGDLLVLNDSRVLPARLFGTRVGLRTQAGPGAPSGVIEVLLTEGAEDPTSQNRDMVHPLLWRALVRPAKKVRVGERLEFRDAGNGAVALRAEVVGAGEFGERTLRFEPVEDFYQQVERIGHMPLPPYIRREQAERPDTEEDRERYQTVYGQQVGSVAAPTAGLHFTPEILEALEARGVEVEYVTLHVGLGTFQPVRVEELKDIRLHSERYTLPARTAAALNRALGEGRRVVAVGTTTTRVLEHVAGAAGADETEVDSEMAAKEALRSGDLTSGAKAPSHSVGVYGTAEAVPLTKDRSLSAPFRAHSGATSIFIGPGHRFRVVGGLLTNFHLPESTLLMLVSAFAAPAGDWDAGRRMVLAAYEHAVRERYRFYSYGDCMLVV